MNTITILFICFTCCFQTAAQNPEYKPVIYKVKIIDTASKFGYLSSLSDSTLFLSAKARLFDPYSTNTANVARIDYQNLREVHLRRQENIGRGALIGTISGAVVGTLYGLSRPNDYDSDYRYLCFFCLTPGQKAVGSGLLMGATGALAGMVVGTLVRRKFIINGNKERFNLMRTKVYKITPGISR